MADYLPGLGPTGNGTAKLADSDHCKLPAFLLPGGGMLLLIRRNRASILLNSSHGKGAGETVDEGSAICAWA